MSADRQAGGGGGSGDFSDYIVGGRHGLYAGAAHTHNSPPRRVRTYMHVCTYVYAVLYSGGGGGAAGQPTTTPPRQSARPIRRLVGVDKVSHGGRYLTTNAESVTPPAFIVCVCVCNGRPRPYNKIIARCRPRTAGGVIKNMYLWRKKIQKSP
jgi:hypothetical protein